jgi:hypothetical protein
VAEEAAVVFSWRWTANKIGCTEPVADGVDDFVTGKVVAVRSSPRSGWSAFPRVMRRSR